MNDIIKFKTETIYTIFYSMMITTLLVGCMNTKYNSINQVKYLGDKSNSLEIYKPKLNKGFYSPIDISFDYIDTVMLIDFNNDPDFYSIELQIFNNDKKGTGALVLLYRNDKMVDVYYTPGLRVNKTMYEIIGGCNVFKENTFQYSFNKSQTGLHASLSLKDISGKLIEFNVKENQQTKQPSSILAPLGAIIKEPTFFPFFYMNEFEFVHRANTDILIKINGNVRKPKKIPILVNGSLVYVCRYATDPIIGLLNKECNKELLELTQRNENGMRYELINQNGYNEIKKVSGSDGKHNVGMVFSPPIPDLICLKNDILVKGKFSIEADSIKGIIGGEYKIKQKNGEINFEMHPIEGWQPMFGKLWVKTYLWEAQLNVRDDNKIWMVSNWKRDNK